MRKIEYLSPSSIQLYRQNKEEFYMKYLCDCKPPRIPQTIPMSIGSAFDAYAKSYLHEALFGKDNDPKFNLVTLFEAQVEPQNRDWAWEHGRVAFEFYKRSGALADLLIELQAATNTPRFEIEVRGIVPALQKTVDGVPFLGKPDVFYINRELHHVILDWKVNGWVSNYPPSPMPGFVRLRNGDGTYNSKWPHKDCLLTKFKGQTINGSQYLDQLNEDWATQIAIYGWLCGAAFGSDFIVAVDQLVCNAKKGGRYPEVRIAEHRLRITEKFQRDILIEAEKIWETVTGGHFFSDLTLEESQAKCLMLDNRSKVLHNPQSEDDVIFAQMTREKY